MDLKNPFYFIKKANKSFNLFLESFKRIDFFLNSYPKDLEGQNQRIDKLNKNVENIIKKSNEDHEIKIKYFFNGKVHELIDMNINPYTLYDICVSNNISFLNILPEKNRFYLKTNNEIILACNSNYGVIKEVFVQNSYLIPKLFEFEEFVLFDVGMHRGYVSLAIGQMDSCKEVYGFEIDPDTFKFAQENLALNPRITKKIHPHSFGLSDSNQDVDLYIIPPMDGRTTTKNSFLKVESSKRDLYTINKKSKIKQASEIFNKIIKSNNITTNLVLKIDTEGAEYEILKDLYHSGILNKFDLVMGECHYGKKELEKYLRDFKLISLDYINASLDGKNEIFMFYYERIKE